MTKSFTEIISAIEEADFMARQESRPYAVVLYRDKFVVLPLADRIDSWEIMEICRA